MGIMKKKDNINLDYSTFKIGNVLAIHADCLEWMGRMPESSIHAIVTDPPYGVKEYNFDQLEKRENGQGGIWRLPPAFDGGKRAPQPRFTALTQSEILSLIRFFGEWGSLASNILKPGGHLMIAANAYLSNYIFDTLSKTGLEFRGQIIRTVRTMRGGDRPKNAEEEFRDACSLPRGCYEPWGLFRKPFSGTVADCLRANWTGALRRMPNGKPFLDLIESERTPQVERLITSHPSLKPQSLMRQLVHAALPLGKGVVLDPFMGSGSTLAAAESIAYSAIGVERYSSYYEESKNSIPALARLPIQIDGWS